MSTLALKILIMSSLLFRVDSICELPLPPPPEMAPPPVTAPPPETAEVVVEEPAVAAATAGAEQVYSCEGDFASLASVDR